MLALVEAMMTLDSVEREIVALHTLCDLTHAEIATELGLAPGTVRWKYRMALRRLTPLVVEAGDG
jgi:DNA-directed RNA polymerase specialized sigma24 family protein